MLRRVGTALVLIPLVLLAIFRAPPWLFILIVELFAMASLWEFSRLLAGYRTRVFPLLYPLVFLLPWVWFYLPPARVPFLVGSALLIAVWSVMWVEDIERGFLSAAGNLGGLWLIGVPLALLTEFQTEQAGNGAGSLGPYQLVLVLVTVWASDSGAYFAGKAFGTRKITPQLSPNKTLEGFVAGLLAAVLAVCLLAFFWFPGWTLAIQVLVGLVIGASAAFGDLFESMIKRGAGVKDTSQLIPGHGGVLDRIDSLLFAFPAYFLVSALL